MINHVPIDTLSSLKRGHRGSAQGCTSCVLQHQENGFLQGRLLHVSQGSVISSHT